MGQLCLWPSCHSVIRTQPTAPGRARHTEPLRCTARIIRPRGVLTRASRHSVTRTRPTELGWARHTELLCCTARSNGPRAVRPRHGTNTTWPPAHARTTALVGVHNGAVAATPCTHSARKVRLTTKAARLGTGQVIRLTPARLCTSTCKQPRNHTWAVPNGQPKARSPPGEFCTIYRAAII